MSWDGRTPAQYVQFLTRPGLSTTAGAVPLASYVSAHGHSPRANAVFRFFESLMRGFSGSSSDYTVDTAESRTAYSGTAAPVIPGSSAETGLNALEQLRQRIMERGGRTSTWRRVFTGQGTAENITDVMNFIADHQAMLQTVVPRGGGASPFAPFFEGGGGALEALRRMASEAVFGMDCLGFTGTYLQWCGVVPYYPEYNQFQYISQLHFQPVASVAEIEDRCVVLWLDGVATQHIGFIDRVTSREGTRITVDFCQSSRGGPQLNAGATLVANGNTYTHGRVTAPKFNIRGGTPVLPVQNEVVVAKRASW